KDALLLKRHPERYKELFHAESHYLSTVGFWENFVSGLTKYSIDEPDWIEALRLHSYTTQNANTGASVRAECGGHLSSWSHRSTGTRLSTDQAIIVGQKILVASELGSETLSLDYPPIVLQNLAEAGRIVEKVRTIVHASGVKTEYVDNSLERYKHYLAA